jgi:hypothetical protein
MKNKLNQISLLQIQLNYRYIRLGLGVVGIILFILSAGAPGTGCATC